MTIWSDPPPTAKGLYWVKHRVSGRESIGKPLSFREWFINGSEVYTPERDFQFGRRIPTNAELGELPGMIELYACKRMNQAEAEAIDEWGDRATFENQAAEYKAKINAILGSGRTSDFVKARITGEEIDDLRAKAAALDAILATLGMTWGEYRTSAGKGRTE